MHSAGATMSQHIKHTPKQQMTYEIIAEYHPLGRPTHRLENNIKMDLTEGRYGLIWVRLGTSVGLL
jgi:hypothetical protein